MKKFHWLLLVLLAIFGAGCSRSTVETTYPDDNSVTDRYVSNSNGLNDNKETLPAISTSSAVYKVHYPSHAHLDIMNRNVVVQTVAAANYKQNLIKAIVVTLLTSEHPSSVDLQTASAKRGVKMPFLLNSVFDKEGQKIEFEWRAERFAKYLVDNAIKYKNTTAGKIYFVEIPLVDTTTKIEDFAENRNSSKIQEYQQFENYIRRAATQYGIRESLIYSIIKTESNFNPKAKSTSDAYGLMQIVPETAGRDVFNLVKNKNGQPSADYLFNPSRNIDTGTAYIYLLKNRYLKDIKNPNVRSYMMISAYNSGAGQMLKTFHSDRNEAIARANRLTAEQVFWALTNKHPSVQARDYLKKVTQYEREFMALASR